MQHPWMPPGRKNELTNGLTQWTQAHQGQVWSLDDEPVDGRCWPPDTPGPWGRSTGKEGMSTQHGGHFGAVQEGRLERSGRSWRLGRFKDKCGVRATLRGLWMQTPGAQSPAEGTARSDLGALFSVSLGLCLWVSISLSLGLYLSESLSLWVSVSVYLGLCLSSYRALPPKEPREMSN